jgi:hypothetical protein
VLGDISSDAFSELPGGGSDFNEKTGSSVSDRKLSNTSSTNLVDILRLPPEPVMPDMVSKLGRWRSFLFFLAVIFISVAVF